MAPGPIPAFTVIDSCADANVGFAHKALLIMRTSTLSALDVKAVVVNVAFVADATGDPLMYH
jgi:hypothetical protein